MTIAIRCPHCSKSHEVPEESLGKPATCQDCGRSFMATGSHDETVAFVQGQTAGSDGGTRRASPRSRIGRYEIRERLGAGVFGTVYRAYDAVLDRDVAIKLPQAAALDSAEARERFLREARAAGKLRHPHIVPVYDCGQEGDEVFIVAAFIEGQTLAAAIAAGQVDRRRAVLIAAKLAHALGTAHQAGIVHRDVKPANVMLDERGEPQLTDFGLAQLGSTSHLTQQGMLLGTPAYMSPEQALGDQSQVGPASDQYSLGVLLYEMLCRRIPFEGPPLTVLYRVREEAPAPPRSIDPTIPPPLEAICLRAMAKQPADRCADCAELSDALRQLDLNAPRAEEPVAPMAPIPPAPAEVRAKSRETAKEPVWQKSPAPAPAGPSGGSGGGSGGGSAGGAFDPYHKWLAIPLAERPPTHYQMLGVTPSESDRDVLNMAALQRSAYVRNFQSGKHSEQATRILNEIAAGLACLLDPAKRAAYDAELRKTRPRSAESKPPAARPAAAPAAAAASPLLDPGLLAAVAAEPLAAPAWMLPPPRRRTGLPWWGVASAVGGVAVLVLVAMIALSGGDPHPTDAGDSQPAVEPEGAASSTAVVQGEGTQGEIPPEAVANPQPETASSAPPPVASVASTEPEAGSQGLPDASVSSAGTSAANRGPPAVAVPPWPADAVEFEGHRYKVFYEQLPWRQAKAKCEGLGGHLPIVASQAENAFLVQLFRQGLAAMQNLDGLWLGATDEAKEGTWLWADGTPLTFRNWAVGQPNNKASEHFLMLWVGRNGSWADQPNASTQHRTFYACEWDAPPSGDAAVTSLFDGTTLQGWEGDPARWNVANGIIVGHKPAGVQGDTYLATRDSYENFVLTMKFHLVEGNSGIQFRGEPLPDRSMTGYEADLTYQNNFKCLGWLLLVGQQFPCASTSATQKQRAIESLGAEEWWNEYRVTADGNRIILQINGVEVVNTTHDGPTRGRIGLQLHGGATATTVEFKDIEIRELPGAIADSAPAASPQLARLDELNTSGWDAFAWVSQDGRSIYWEANATRAPVGCKIWHAERPDTESPFGNKRALIDGRQPALTPDEKQIVFVFVTPDGQERLHSRSRQSRSERFGPMQAAMFPGYVGYNNPWISPDGLHLHVNAVSADETLHYLVSRRASLTEPWGPPATLDVRWDLAKQGLPLSWLALSADELSLLATHEGTIGQWRVVRFRRATPGGPFDDYEYLTLPGIGQVSGKAPRYVAATRELHLTLKPSAPGSRPNDPADLAVIRNVGAEAVGLSAAGATPLIDDQPANPSTADDDDDGFRFLFNGTDLSGWRVIGGPREGWVRGGVLVSDGAEGDLATEAEYSDFELALEFRVGRDANSGILLRAADGDKEAFDCLEVQIIDDVGPKYSNATPPLKPEQRTGSIYNVVAASPPGSAPSGQWQTLVIRCQGASVKITLDDRVRVNTDLTRFRNRAQQFPGINRRRGHIKLQHHTGRVEFRNICVRELP